MAHRRFTARLLLFLLLGTLPVVAKEPKPAAYCDRALSGQPLAVESEDVGPALARAETAILGLRLNDGIALTPAELASLAPCLDAGLLDLDGPHARLTPKGRLLSNEAFWRLLPN